VRSGEPPALSVYTRNFRIDRSIDLFESDYSILRARRQCHGSFPGREHVDGGGARDHGGDRVRRAVAGVEHRAAGVGGRAGRHARLRRRHGAAVHALRRLLPVAGPRARPAPQPHLRRRRRQEPRYVPRAIPSFAFSPLRCLDGRAFE
jgi:hypothetical protein